MSDIDPRDTAGLDIDKDEAKAMLKDSIQRLSDLQEMLYAQDRWAVLAIFQAMDAAGKDGVIEHVMSGVNPQGCQVYSFKAPTTQELDHDFMWRTTVAMPERGRIGIFNRSYYEEVLVVRAQPGNSRDSRRCRPHSSARISGRSGSRISAISRNIRRATAR